MGFHDRAAQLRQWTRVQIDAPAHRRRQGTPDVEFLVRAGYLDSEDYLYTAAQSPVDLRIVYDLECPAAVRVRNSGADRSRRGQAGPTRCSSPSAA